MSVLVIGLVCVATFLFSLDPARPPLFRILDYIAITSEVASILVLHLKRSTEALFWTVGPVIVPVQFLFLLMNGNAEGDILAFFMVPVAAVVIFGPERSRPWFWVCAALLMTATLSGEDLPAWTSPLAISPVNPSGSIFHSPASRAMTVGEGLAMGVGCICLYLLTYSVYKQLESANDIILLQKAELEREHERSERLLNSILPESAARRLKDTPDATIYDDLGDVTILFADIVGFTELAGRIAAPDLVSLLCEIFSSFDKLADKHGLEKIKTIGDAYMVAGGVPVPHPDHAQAAAGMALDMLTVINEIGARTGVALNLRIGIASGPAVAGVIASRKPFYDIWGDTVNLASRLEATSDPGRIQISATTERLLDGSFITEPRGKVDVKGKGQVHTFLLIGNVD